MRPNATRSAILQSASSFVSSPVSLPRLLPFASPSSTVLQLPPQPFSNHLPTTTRPLLASCSSDILPHPFTHLAPALHLLCTHHPLTNPPRRLSATVLQPPNQPLPNNLSIAFQPPSTRSSPAHPPICRDKAGHPHPSHTATKPNAQTLQPQLSHTARPTVPYEQF